MHPTLNSLLLAALLAVAVLLVGCDSSSPTDAPDLTWDDPASASAFAENGAPFLSGASTQSLRTQYGPTRPLGNGVTRTFVTFGTNGDPMGLGVMISEKAFQNLPAHGSHDEHMLALQFPRQAKDLFADHLSLDWNPHGHEPEFLFGTPHFDLHFYTVTEQERMTWTPADPEFDQKLALAPEAQYMPAGYIQFPGGVPMMGAHWGDSADPTFAPGGPAFTEVLLWGSYDGDVVFIEPMITNALFLSRTAHSEAIAQPQSVQKTGFYPQRYTISYDAKRKAHVVAMHDLTFRLAN